MNPLLFERRQARTSMNPRTCVPVLIADCRGQDHRRSSRNGQGRRAAETQGLERTLDGGEAIAGERDARCRDLQWQGALLVGPRSLLR